jgi:hypothetical protein
MNTVQDRPKRILAVINTASLIGTPVLLMTVGSQLVSR